MKTLSTTALFAIATALLFSALQATLVTNPAPEGAPRNAQYEVRVREAGGESKPLFVYDAVFDPKLKSHCGFLIFDADFSRPVEVVIRRRDPFTEVRVRPESRGVTATPRGGHAGIILDRPAKLSIEFDGDIQTPLYIFANGLEKDPITEPGDDVVYYGPGIHLLGGDGTGRVPIEAGTTVYLAGGAVVYGRIEFGGKDQVTVRSATVFRKRGFR